MHKNSLARDHTKLNYKEKEKFNNDYTEKEKFNNDNSAHNFRTSTPGRTLYYIIVEQYKELELEAHANSMLLLQ